MPFRSSKQRKFLFSQKPAVARKFAAHSPGAKGAGKAVTKKQAKRGGKAHRGL